jgi:hypothetical protein
MFENPVRPTKASSKNSEDLLQQMSETKVTAAEVVQAYPKDKAAIQHAYAQDPKSIQYADVETLCELILTPIRLEDALAVVSDAINRNRLINSAYPKKPKLVMQMLQDSLISPDDIVKALPREKSIIKAAYTKDPLSIRYAAIDLLLDLVPHPITLVSLFQAFSEETQRHAVINALNEKNANIVSRMVSDGSLTLQELIKSCPTNKKIIWEVYNKDKSLIKHANVTVVARLLFNPIDFKDALAIFSTKADRQTLIYQAYTNNKLLVLGLVDEGVILASELVSAYPSDIEAIKAAYEKDPASIAHADSSVVAELLFTPIKLEDAVAAFTNNVPAIKELLTKAYATNKELVLQMLQDNTLSPKDLAQAFPNNIDLVQAAYTKDPTIVQYIEFSLIRNFLPECAETVIALLPDYKDLLIKLSLFTNPELIRELIDKKVISPFDAVKSLPRDKEVLKFAYANDVRSIQYADLSIILELMPDPISYEYVLTELPDGSLRSNLIAHIYSKNKDLVLDRLSDGSLNVNAFIKALPHDKEAIKAAYKKDPRSIQYAFYSSLVNLIPKPISYEYALTELPDGSLRNNLIAHIYSKNKDLVLDRLSDGSLNVNAFIKALPYDKEAIKAAFDKDPNSIQYALYSSLADLIPDSISLQDVLKTANEIGIQDCVSRLFHRNQAFIVQMINEGILAADILIKAMPDNFEAIKVAYEHDPTLIRYAQSKKVIDLLFNPISLKVALANIKDAYCKQLLVLEAYQKNKEELIRAMKENELSPNLVLSVATHDIELIKIAYEKDHYAIRNANPELVAQLIPDFIALKDALNAFYSPTDYARRTFITACYSKDKEQVLKLVRENLLAPAELLQIYPSESEVLKLAYEKDESLLRTVSPDNVLKLLGAPIGYEEAIKAFPSNQAIIKAVYALDPSLVQFAIPEAVCELVGADIDPAMAIKLFPDNNQVLSAACLKDKSLLNAVSPQIVLNLIGKGISASEAVKAYPKNELIIREVYRINPSEIQYAEVETVLSLVQAGLIVPMIAEAYFPDNKALHDLVSAMDLNTKVLIRSESELAELIKRGFYNPYQAVKQHPKSREVVSAAYERDPFSIECANRELINELGAAQVIKQVHVAQIFSAHIPTQEELEEITKTFNKAKKEKNWPQIAAICKQFWFAKPKEAAVKTIESDLSNRNLWQDFHDFAQAFYTEESLLTYGPLTKVPETYQLEQMARKMMIDADFKIELSDGEDYFVFADGTRFNWTRIQACADLQQVDLEKSDFALYSSFIDSDNAAASSSLDPSQENTYRQKLYANPNENLQNAVKLPEPDDAITFQEMQAIHIFTGTFYEKMNGLMRDERDRFDYTKGRTELSQSARDHTLTTLRSALVHSVMVASGLRKIPEVVIPQTYRGGKPGSIDVQKERVRTAAQKGLFEMQGFFSTSRKQTTAANFDRGLFYTVGNLRGVYVAPISAIPSEQEFLIPQAQFKVTNYLNKSSHHMDISVVSDLEFHQQKTQRFEPIAIAYPEPVAVGYPGLDRLLSALIRDNLASKQVDESAVKSLLLSVCSHENSYSTETEQALYLIDRLKSDKELRGAFGLKIKQSTSKETDPLIKKFMERAWGDDKDSTSKPCTIL